MINKKIHLSHIITIFIMSISALSVALFVNSSGTANKTIEEQISTISKLNVQLKSAKWLNNTAKANLKASVSGGEVVFLASSNDSQIKDLYCANVKTSPKNVIVSLENLTNLTKSSVGDDYKYLILGNRILVATRALLQVRSLTLFNLDGQKLGNNESWSFLQRILARITDIQKTGRLKGIDKKTYRFVKPPADVNFNFLHKKDNLSIIIEWIDSHKKKHIASIDINNEEFETDELEVMVEVRLPKRPVLWLVDTVRAISWIGPGPIEWAEGRFFAIRDKYRQLKYVISGDDGFEEENEQQLVVPKELIVLPNGLEIGNYKSNVHWPPKELAAPVFSRKRKGEGLWSTALPPFVKTLPGAPATMYKTYIRSDIRRPYVRVHLIAIDTRQTELHMVGGHEDPRSTTGAVGTGKLPRDPEILSRVIAAFNGAFKSEHGSYGMMANHNVLLPPQNNIATVATYKNGQIALGSWPEGQGIPENMVSYRQNMDPLVEDGVVNPKKRYLWGFTLDEDIKNMNTIRSGLCMRNDGTMIYAWGEDLTARTLGIAMNAANCIYGMHLDMNPFHTSFIAYNFEEQPKGKKPKFESSLLMKQMRFSPNRYVNGAPKDFFYLTLRKNSPGKNWNNESIAQSKPAFIPSIFTRELEELKVVAADLTAIKFSLYAGEVSPDLAILPKNKNQTDEELLVEIILGPWSSNRGQVTNETIISTLQQDKATIAIDKKGFPVLINWESGISSFKNAIQGNWIIQNGIIIQKNDLKENVPSEQDIIIGIAVDNDKWLYFTKGSRKDVCRAFAKLNIKNAIGFVQTETKLDIIIRNKHGMINLQGQQILTRNPENATLKIFASPRTHFGVKL